jgi:predicted GNAT family acetyltransferase
MIITDTEVPKILRGKGIAKQLVAFVMKYALKMEWESMRKSALAIAGAHKCWLLNDVGRPARIALVAASASGFCLRAFDKISMPQGP